ncbi:MAG: efflux RND transporter periplasmic adaptor subunit [Bacteroidales bacterium]|nr:efflux RND transporter periplasmic adaptor subunit [Bacteroidales bacterium]
MDRIIEDKRRIKPKHWKIIIPSGIIIAAVIFLSTRNSMSTFRVEKDKIQIAKVFEDDFEDYIKINGRVEPISTIYLDAIEGGRVEEIYIREGTMVQKNDVILRLSNNNLNLGILDSEAQLAEKSNYLREVILNMEQQKLQSKREIINMEYQLKQKKREYERNKLLYNQDLIAREEFLQSEDGYNLSSRLFQIMKDKEVQDSIYRNIQIEQMNQNLSNMKKNLALVYQRLDNLNIKAPHDGQLGMLDAEIGQSVSPGQRIGQINVLTSYKIAAEIDEHYIDRVRAGLVARIDRDNKQFTLKVKKVYPEVREGRFRIDLVFEGELPENMRSGQTYYVDLQLGDPQKCVQVSKGGFFQSTGGQWVYVVDASGDFAIKRQIKIGRQNPQYFEVMEGLTPGGEVIVSGYELFGENERIVFK